MSANSEPKNDFETQAKIILFCIKENNATKVVSTLCLLSAEVRKQIVSFKVNQNTALCAAVTLGHKDIVEYLLKNCEADINQRGIFIDEKDNQHKVPPIWCAAESGRVDIASLLLFYGADVNDCSDTESTPVRCACFMNHQLMVEFLVENGGNLSKTNIYGGTCLINSVGCSGIVEFLIAKGVEVNSADRNGWTALHYAAEEGHVNSVRILLTNNADYTIRNKGNRTALNSAAFEGHDMVVEEFMQNGCGTNIQFVDSYDLLGAIISIQILKRHVQTKDVSEVISMFKDHIFSCEAILSIRPVNIQTINNYKYLLQSVIHIINVFRCLERDPYEQNDFLKIIQELVRLNTTTYDGESLLHLAVDPQTGTVDDTYFSQIPSLEVVKVLLECGIDTNRSDKDGLTALLCSIKYSHQNEK
ncbi:unnamed protein product [Mytilus edulis]|uniref:Uncharacterized protein n=1 Tax=Mytilus edulis TaxID=6550 RepID=A0A8S3RKR0_MYTED|nr:unnamed protein product [Mytilus edulis]